jgi:hypothetical protein
VHAFVFDALAGADIEELREACAWADGVLSDESIDRSGASCAPPSSTISNRLRQK